MAYFAVKDAAGATIYLLATGSGTTIDPYAPTHAFANSLPAGAAIIGKVDVVSLPVPTGAAISAANTNAPAANTAAVITYAAAGASVANVIGNVVWSYNATPTAGNLKIEDGSGTTVLSVDITAAGPGFIPFARPLKGTSNTALIVTLSAGGAAVSGRVNVSSKWTE